MTLWRRRGRSGPRDARSPLNSSRPVIHHVLYRRWPIPSPTEPRCSWRATRGAATRRRRLPPTARFPHGTSRRSTTLPRLCSASAPANISGSYFSSCNAACSSFNDDISGWDTSHGTTFESAFRGAQFFNRPLNWDTSRHEPRQHLPIRGRLQPAARMEYLARHGHALDIRGAAAFDQPLAWDTSQATSLDDTFTGTSSLGQCNRALIAFTFSASPAFRSSSWSSWSQDTTAGCSPSPPPSPPPPFPPTSPPYEPPPPSTPPPRHGRRPKSVR